MEYLSGCIRPREHPACGHEINVVSSGPDWVSRAVLTLLFCRVYIGDLFQTTGRKRLRERGRDARGIEYGMERREKRSRVTNGASALRFGAGDVRDTGLHRQLRYMRMGKSQACDGGGAHVALVCFLFFSSVIVIVVM